MKTIKKITLFIMSIIIVAQFSLAFAVDVTSITPVDSEMKSDAILGLNQPYGLATDYLGNVYVADTYNNVIKIVTAKGLQLVAGGVDGKNTMGFPRGGLVDGNALTARFNKPRDIFITMTGVIYVADTGNHVIRKIENSMVTTISGTGSAGFVDGVASEAQFNLPSALTMDSEGRLYVADTLNNCIRVISKNGSARTLAFTPDQKTLTSAKLNEPSDLLFDDKGTLYILDSGNQAVKCVKDGVISLVAGSVNDVNLETGYVNTGLVNGTAKEARFDFPKGFVMDSRGNIFIADSWNHAIRVITTDGNVATYSGAIFSGNTKGDIKEARFNTPTGIVIRNNALVVSDMWNNEIKEIPIDYNDISFGITAEALKALIDPAQTTEAWTFWKAHKKVDFDKPIVKEDGIYYLPFKAVMMHYGYEISWDATSRQVLYAKDDLGGFIDDSVGMKLYENNSYLSVDQLEKITNKKFGILDAYRAIVEVE